MSIDPCLISSSTTAGEVKNSSSFDWISISFLSTERHTLYVMVENVSTKGMIMSKSKRDEDTKRDDNLDI